MLTKASTTKKILAVTKNTAVITLKVLQVPSNQRFHFHHDFQTFFSFSHCLENPVILNKTIGSTPLVAMQQETRHKLRSMGVGKESFHFM